VSFDKLASVHKQSGDVNFLACASARNRWRGARRGFGLVFAIGLGLSAGRINQSLHLRGEIGAAGVAGVEGPSMLTGLLDKRCNL
jgi:hypothetical protein